MSVLPSYTVNVTCLNPFVLRISDLCAEVTQLVAGSTCLAMFRAKQNGEDYVSFVNALLQFYSLSLSSRMFVCSFNCHSMISGALRIGLRDAISCFLDSASGS